MNMALAGMVILALGDSHMAGKDYLLTNLHEALEAQGASVHSYGMCGAAAGDWLYRTTVSCGHGEHHDNSPPLFDIKTTATWNVSELIEKHHPNLVIIESADAMANYGNPELPKAWIYDQVHALVGKISAQKISCVWVGPIWGSEGPPYHKVNTRVKEMSEFLSQSVAPCRFVDSTRLSKPGELPTPDGQHLTPAGYHSWGEYITNAVVRMKTQNALK
jgi:hypothetical protein